ncbi:unnamed protein product [Rotaria sordida]|uniref:Uncharacterized protein n=1 Tax=Rotaria sordida TaxID=392033 RepID=A0A819G2B1_9BILA|nr:unnamed protein product [Rotaria sordida]CAF3872970.1 unnamed protein product [Rotaria sordida]
MTSTNDIGLATERVQCSTTTDLNDLVCSTICENILWKPVACQQCETHFCSMCIRQWLNKNSNQCPMRCDKFIERSCSKFIAKRLAQLQIICIYQPNGCNEVIPYEALEKHETMCGYQLIKCTGCLSEILKKDFSEHQLQCPLTVTTCADCKIVYKQNDVFKHHSDAICLREQLRHLRQESQYEIQQLKEQIRQEQKAPVPSHIITDLTKLRVRCAYAPNGCRVISFYYDLEQHEKTCEFEMIPCKLCQLPLSRRPPIVEHTRRACFEYMLNKNPAGIQQQFMILFNAVDEAKADNHRLQSTINDIKTQLNKLNSICLKNSKTNSK